MPTTIMMIKNTFAHRSAHVEQTFNTSNPDLVLDGGVITVMEAVVVLVMVMVMVVVMVMVMVTVILVVMVVVMGFLATIEILGKMKQLK